MNENLSQLENTFTRYRFVLLLLNDNRSGHVFFNNLMRSFNNFKIINDLNMVALKNFKSDIKNYIIDSSKYKDCYFGTNGKNIICRQYIKKTNDNLTSVRSKDLLYRADLILFINENTGDIKIEKNRYYDNETLKTELFGIKQLIRITKLKSILYE